MCTIWSYCQFTTSLCFCLFLADSLSYTSAISVALSVVFVIITAGIAIVKLIKGQIPMPKLFPDVPDLASVWELFTAVPVLVTAYVCHYNGMRQIEVLNYCCIKKNYFSRADFLSIFF